MESGFVESGIEFFKTCNYVFSCIRMFFSNPTLYISAYAFNICLLITVIAIFAKACGFNSGKWVAGGTVGSVLFKILFLTAK